MLSWLSWTKRPSGGAGRGRRAGAASAGGAPPAPPAAVLSETVGVPTGDPWAMALLDAAERRGDVLTELPTR